MTNQMYDSGKIHIRKGYFTVEASLLMSLILPMLVALLIIGFYVHDQAKMQSIVCEAAAKGSNLREYDNREKLLQSSMKSRTENAAMWSKNVNGTVETGKKKVTAVCSGSFSFPQIMSLFGKSGTSTQEKQWSRKIYQPASLIRKVRGVKGLADALTKGTK